MTTTARILVTALCAALLASGGSASAEDDAAAPKDWYAEAVAAKEIDEKAYRGRIDEILADVNATRETFAGVGPLTWDVEGSEGHFRHARWLLHHMREPWNSGGVTDFRDQEPGSELYDEEGRQAAKISIIAFKYIKRRGKFEPSERWLPMIGQRLPWLTRSAQKAFIGYAEGVVPEGAEFEGWKWGVVVLSTDADYKYRRSGIAQVEKAPVICPVDGATDVPIQLRREVPEMVPEHLDMEAGKKRELGFPITFSFFGGQAILSGLEVELIKIEKVRVEVEDDEPRRQPPGKRRKKKKSKKESEPVFEEVETPVEFHLSAPRQDPLRGNATWNSNTVVIIPHAPLEPGATYRATFKGEVGDGGDPESVELTTTFSTLAAER